MTNKITKDEQKSIREDQENSRSYSNGEVTVFWRAGLCIHSANCLIGLPKVFNTVNRPWININGASTDEIINVVNTCPSRALTYLKNQKNTASQLHRNPPEKALTEIRILKNGPAMVSGNFIIKDQDNREIKVEHEIASICRCGASSRKPFCDGTHYKIGFSD